MKWRQRFFTQTFPQQNIAGLISGITFIVLFSQEKPLRRKEINTRARTQTGFYSTFFKVKSLVVSFKRGCFLAKFWFFLKTVYIIFYLTFTERFFVFQHIWVAKIVLKSWNLENWWNLREKNVENWWNLREKNVENWWNLREKNVENGGLEVMGREA